MLDAGPPPDAADDSQAVDDLADEFAAGARRDETRAAGLSDGEDRKQAQRDASGRRAVARQLVRLAAAIRQRRLVESDRRCVICKGPPEPRDDGPETPKRALCELHRMEFQTAAQDGRGWRLQAAETFGLAVIGGGRSVALVLLPTRQYARQRAKALRYERLLWDVRSYLLFALPAASQTEFYGQMTIWLKLREEAGS